MLVQSLTGNKDRLYQLIQVRPLDSGRVKVQTFRAGTPNRQSLEVGADPNFVVFLRNILARTGDQTGTVVRSRAGVGQSEYVLAQVDNGHVQVSAPGETGANRSYGYSTELPGLKGKL